MADLAQTYDELAAHYDQLFEDWEASMARQSTVLAGILQRECGDKRPIRVLDCACGIGTQSLGLAMKGFDVEGCDISIGAVRRARSEASKRGLSVLFSVVNMMRLSAVAKSGFDAVICIDNSRPHLQTDEDLLYLPHREKFGHYLSKHSHNLARVRHSLWNSGIEMADWYMTIFRCGLAEDAWDHPEIDIKRFQAIETKLDEIRNYLYAAGKAVAGYARAFRRGERVGTAHVESTVNHLINWRFCKKQQMAWTKQERRPSSTSKPQC